MLTNHHHEETTMFTIDIFDTDTQEWRDSGEGPWNTYQQAIQFGQDECGMPWRVQTMTGHDPAPMFAHRDWDVEWFPPAGS